MNTATAQQPSGGRRPSDSFPLRLMTIRYELGMEERGKILPVDVIAARCGIASATWSTWERGTTPHNLLEVVGKIAHGTGYDRNWVAWGLDISAQRKLTLVKGGLRDSKGSQPTRSPLLRVVDSE